jgi:hypothetical protein
MIAKTHYMRPRDRTSPKRPRYLASTTTPAKPNRTRRNAKVRGRTSPTRNHPRVMESIRRELLLYQKERWKIMPGPRLLTHQQMDKEK